MNRIIIDSALQRQLNDPCTELLDAQGTTIGFCLTPAEYRRLIYDQTIAAVSDDELDRAERETGGMTTPELLAHLKSLDRPRTGAA